MGACGIWVAGLPESERQQSVSAVFVFAHSASCCSFSHYISFSVRSLGVSKFSMLNMVTSRIVAECVDDLNRERLEAEVWTTANQGLPVTISRNLLSFSSVTVRARGTDSEPTKRCPLARR